VAELSTRRLQVKTVALSRVAYNIAAIVVNVLTPYMIVSILFIRWVSSLDEESS